MLRICGTTYTFTANYGSCFQAYALQKAIESLDILGGVEYRLIPIAKSPGYPKVRGIAVKRRIKAFVSKYSHKAFIAFEKKYMHYAPLKPLSCFQQYNDIMDGFVCGSDVVWNPKYNHGLNEYYLSFAEKYSFSYAASFGQGDIDESEYPRIGALLARLNDISVREPKSADIVRKCSGRDATLTLDPVFLLGQDEWNRIAEKDNREGDYIFVYSVNTTPLLKQFVAKLKVQTGMKVIVSGGNAGAVLKQRQFRIYTPERWLQLMRDAKYVVTDSFHGTAFSVLFKKTLFTIIDGSPDQGFNVRMSDFLRGVGLEDRMVSGVPGSIDCAPVDYKKASELLRERIDRSKDYLVKNVEAVFSDKQARERKNTIEGEQND